MSAGARQRLLGAGVVALTVAAVGAGAGFLLPGTRPVDVYPLEGMVRTGQPIHLMVQVDRPWYARGPVTVIVTRGLDSAPLTTLQTEGGLVTWTPPEPGGYGVTVIGGGSRAFSAFDVGDRWSDYPRYGFLSDFGPQDRGQSQRFDDMARFHLNGLQFYDWMYRHSDYLPPTQAYRDPLGRTLSANTVREKVKEAQRRGMAAMAYTAAYAAPPEFLSQHPDWGLYDVTGSPITFGDGFLAIMNPEPGGPWTEHLVREYGKIVNRMGFDGIHIDQYGDPHFGFAYPGGSEAREVDVGSALGALINRTRNVIGPDRTVLVNDVSGWPLSDTAGTANDAVYIEVWPPDETFGDLHRLIVQARRLSDGKAVVLAAYINPAFEPSVLLTDATIFASGGYHIELGEGDGMLADPYFPKYRRLSGSLREHLRRYYDVIVRYRDVLYGQGLQDWTPEVSIEGSEVLDSGYFGGIWPIGREDGKHRVLNLINLNGLEGPAWKAPRSQAPALLEDRQVTVSMEAAPRRVYAIQPDSPDPSPRPVTFAYEGGKVTLRLDRLAYWSILVFEK
ncbi:MAG: glycoside hydrolase family 66 protein [Bacillota bacterium]